MKLSISSAQSIGLAFGLVIVAFTLIRVGWVADDALITLRHALNAANGLGFGFNVSENVQGYTHPLWFLLWLLIGGLSNHWIVAIVGLSLFLTLGAIAVAYIHLSIRGGGVTTRVPRCTFLVIRFHC